MNSYNDNEIKELIKRFKKDNISSEEIENEVFERINYKYILPKFSYIEILNSLINHSQNSLCFIHSLNFSSNIEFWNILVEMTANNNLPSLLISFNKRDNVYQRYSATRFSLPADYDINFTENSKIDFVKRYFIEHPINLTSINFNEERPKNLELIIKSFIESGTKQIFLQNIGKTNENIKLIKELQLMAEENKIALVVQFHSCLGVRDESLNCLNNLIYINHKIVDNNILFYFENIKNEQSELYELDRIHSSIKLYKEQVNTNISGTNKTNSDITQFQKYLTADCFQLKEFINESLERSDYVKTLDRFLLTKLIDKSIEERKKYMYDWVYCKQQSAYITYLLTLKYMVHNFKIAIEPFIDDAVLYNLNHNLENVCTEFWNNETE